MKSGDLIATVLEDKLSGCFALPRHGEIFLRDWNLIESEIGDRSGDFYVKFGGNYKVARM